MSSNSNITVDPSSIPTTSHAPFQTLLQCSYCQKSLSVAPIFSDCDKNITICGRCNPSNTTAFVRQHLYEKLAEHMTFPCANSNIGCLAKLKFSDVPTHESGCHYKRAHCPYSILSEYTELTCNWSGSALTLNQHLENGHRDQILARMPDMNFSELKTSTLYMARILKQLMIFTVTYTEPSHFTCVVMVNGSVTDCDAYRCQIEFFDETRQHTLIMRHSRLENMISCAKNISECKTIFEFDLATIGDFLQKTDVILGRFGIIRKSRKELNGRVTERPDAHIDDNLLKELECPICNLCMTPPVLMCASGHSICSKCREKLTQCPTCRSQFNRARNYTLENLITVINYPCSFKEFGCDFVATGDKLALHETGCAYGGSKCFLPNCDSRVGLTMLKHLHETHSRSLISLNEMQILDVDLENKIFRTADNPDDDDYDDIYEDFNEDTFKCYAISYGDDIFRLLINYEAGWMKFAMDQYGVAQSSYTYEIQIIDTTTAWEKLSITKECPAMNEDIYSLLDDCIHVSESMLMKFINDDELLFFKIVLKKE